ncbi:MAG: hypothetical protein ABI337_09700 [Nitrososphaera sp.]
MSDIPLQIRKEIFEKYNDPDIRFTKDENYTILQKCVIINKNHTKYDIEQKIK